MLIFYLHCLVAETRHVLVGSNFFAYQFVIVHIRQLQLLHWQFDLVCCWHLKTAIKNKAMYYNFFDVRAALQVLWAE